MDEKAILNHHKDGTYTLLIDGIESEIEDLNSESLINIKRVEKQ